MSVSTPAQPRLPRRPDVTARRAKPRPSWIVRQLTSMRVALIMLFALGLLTLAGTLLSQAPAEAQSSSATYAEWLNLVRPKYGGWTDVLNALGLFTVFQSIIFKAIFVYLSASVLTCSLRRAPGLWRTAMRPRLVMTDAFYAKAPLRASVASTQEQSAALESVSAAFRKDHFHVTTVRNGEDVQICADRFRWSPFGRVLAHLAFVVILVGAVVSATGGFRDESVVVPIGDKVEVGHGTNLSVEAKSFTDSYYASGPPKEYSSRLAIYKGDQEMMVRTARVNHPVRYDGVTIYQSFFGPAVDMTATTPTGQVLFDQGVAQAFVADKEKDRVGRFEIPQKGLTAFVVSPASGETDPSIPPGSTQLEVYRVGKQSPVGIETLSQGKPATIAGVNFTFVREREFTGLIISHDPGVMIVWIGAAMLVLGLFGVFYFPHRRIRAVVRVRDGGSEVGVAAIERRNVTFAEHFQQLVEDIRRAVGDGAENEKGGTVDA